MRCIVFDADFEVRIILCDFVCLISVMLICSVVFLNLCSIRILCSFLKVVLFKKGGIVVIQLKWTFPSNELNLKRDRYSLTFLSA